MSSSPDDRRNAESSPPRTASASTLLRSSEKTIDPAVLSVANQIGPTAVPYAERLLGDPAPFSSAPQPLIDATCTFEQHPELSTKACR
jgi:hypothetical protein